MKRFGTAVLAAVLAFSFSACGIVPALGENIGGHIDSPHSDSGVMTGAVGNVTGSEEIGGVFDTEISGTAENSGTDPKKEISLPAVELSSLSVPAYEEIEAFSVPVEFLTFRGSVTGPGYLAEYSFVAPESGVYAVEGTDMFSDLKLTVEIVDAKNMRVVYASGLGGGNTLCADLEKGGKYTVEVSYKTGAGAYTLMVGQQKAAVDLTGATFIEDSIEFNNQENYYYYTPSVSGTYSFSFPRINSENKVSIYVFDSLNYRLKYVSQCSRDGVLSIELEANETYKIAVVEHTGRGEYTLSVGVQKETAYVEGYSIVCDSIQFANQINNYSFTATVSGAHRIEVENIDSGNSISFFLYDSEGYRLKYITDRDAGGGMAVELEAGETYTLAVEECRGFVPYSFFILGPKEAVDVTGFDLISDSFSFDGQENAYVYTPAISGDHRISVASAQSGLSVGVSVYDALGYRLAVNSSMDQNEGVTVSLTGGEEYTIKAVYSNSCGAYTLSLE